MSIFFIFCAFALLGAILKIYLNTNRRDALLVAGTRARTLWWVRLLAFFIFIGGGALIAWASFTGDSGVGAKIMAPFLIGWFVYSFIAIASYRIVIESDGFRVETIFTKKAYKYSQFNRIVIERYSIVLYGSEPDVRVSISAIVTKVKELHSHLGDRIRAAQRDRAKNIGL